MSHIKSCNTTKKNVHDAINELKLGLHKNPSLILFFASAEYDFQLLNKELTSHYPSSQIVGVTTTGEMGPKGFSQYTLSAQSYTSDLGKMEAVLMNDIVKYPMFERNNLKATAKNANVNIHSKQPEKEGVAFIFPVGLHGGEENMLSIVNSIFEYDGFNVFGGTAGDDAKFHATYVSVNGECSSTGGAVIFIKPKLDFVIYQENIFKSTNVKLNITKADPSKRIVYEIDGKKAAKAYADALNVPLQKLTDNWFLHPLGRKFNNDYYNASPFTVHSDGSVEFYCQVYEGAVLEVLEPLNPVEQLSNTIEQFTKQFEQLEGVLAVNCILRKLQFEKQNLYKPLNDQLSKLPNLCGFSSYGEQINKSQLNQTLVMIGFGKKL